MHRNARRTLRGFIAPAIWMALAALPVEAQSYRTAVGVMGGWSTSGDLTPGLGFETVLEDGWTAGAQLELWPWTGRMGFRLSGTFASRGLEGTSRSFTVDAADLGLMVRLLRADRDRVIAPFVAVGAGGIRYRAETHQPPLGDGEFGDDPVLRLTVVPSLGVDLFTRSIVGLRLEVVDQVVFPGVGTSPLTEGLLRVHNPGVRAGVQLRGGRPPQPVVARGPVARPQPQAAPATPRPAPDPEPPQATPPPPQQPPAQQPQQPATPPPAQHPLPPPADAEAALFTVQVGAYPGTAMARARVSWLEGSGLPIWLTEVVVRGERLVRVRVGAADSREDAQLLVRRLAREFGLETWVTTLDPEEIVPPDGIVATMRFLFSD
jgi:cell division septation protein DedD